MYYDMVIVEEEEGPIANNGTASPDAENTVRSFIEIIGEKRLQPTTENQITTKRQKNRISLTFTLQPDKLEEGFAIFAYSPSFGYRG